MRSHVLVLAAINLVRAFIGLGLGAYFLYFSERTRIPLQRATRLEEGDLIGFAAVGWLLVAFAVLRALHGVAVLVELGRFRRGAASDGPRGLAIARWLGKGLSIVDLVNIVLFPLSTACGLYGFHVYRRPDTVDFYERRFST